MFTTITITLALLSQAPAPTAKPASRAVQTRRDYADVVSRKRARLAVKGKLAAAGRAREAVEAANAYKAAQDAQAQYVKMLPYMLENQRQQLARQSEFERNAALHRMADAMLKDTAAAQWRAIQQGR